MQPKVLLFDSETQLPVTKQVISFLEEPTASTAVPHALFKLPVAEWQQSPVAKQLGRPAAFGSAVLLTLWARHTAAVADARCEIQVDVASGKRRVVVLEKQDRDAIGSWPCVPKASKVHEKSTHADRAKVQVIVKGDMDIALMTFYLHPEFKLPIEAPRAEAAVSDTQQRSWKWDGGETMHFFWAVRKVIPGEGGNARDGGADARPNMELQERELAVCVTGTCGLVLAIKVPVLVNNVPAMPDEEVVYEGTPKVKAKAQPKKS